MYADVIPFTRIPKPAQAFTYLVPDALRGQIRIGQFVEVPWRGSKQFGVISAMRETSPIPRVSPLLRVIEDNPSWDASVLAILTTLADVLHVSWSLMARSFAPTIPQRKRVVAPAVSANMQNLATLSRQQIEPIKALAQNTQSASLIFKFRQHGERLFLYRELCAQALEKDGQILFLMPQIDDALQLQSYLSAYYAEGITVWDAQAPANEQWRRWQACHHSPIIITTRSGVFLPAPRLSCLVIDQDDMPEHKQWEAAPHYDARMCASMRASAAKARLVRTAIVPRVETISSGDLTESTAVLAPVETIFHNAQALLSDRVTEALSETIANRGSAILICTHKARARLLRCLDCQHRWLCPSCSTPLQEQDNQLRCPVCERAEPIPAFCPTCRSQRIRAYGPGLEQVQAHLQQTMAAPVLRWDADEQTEPDTSKPHLIISTPYACKPLLANSAYKTLILFHPESTLFHPDFRANEQYYHLTHFHRVGFHHRERTMIIQTSLPIDHPWHAYVVQDQYQPFAKQELSLRHKLQYPPYAFMIKYIYRGRASEEISAITTRLRRQHTYIAGPFHQRRPAATYWVTKVVQLQDAKLDNPQDSVYNKLVIDVNPHHL